MKKATKKYFWPALILLGFALLQLPGCSAGTGQKSPAYDQIKSYIDEIKVADTHEHLSTYMLLEDRDVNTFTLLQRSYINSDFITAGMGQVKIDVIDEGDHDKLWGLFGPYLDFTRATNYYSHILAGFSFLYDFDFPTFTKENTRLLSQAVTANYKDFDSWFDTAFTKAGFETMFIDPHWNTFASDKFYDKFALVMRLDSFIMGASERIEMGRPDSPKRNNPFFRAEEDGFAIGTLDDYLEYAEKWFRFFKEKNAVTAKTAVAYNRSLDFEDVNREEAEALFKRPSDKLNSAQKKKIQDFVFHWCVKKCTEYDLPLQIHTGYLAGNRKKMDGSRPFLLENVFDKYRDTKFILFHGGFPWYTEVGVLAKHYPNVYLDVVWMPQISREAAADAIHQWLDLVPYNKFFWGGDCTVIEGSAGALVEMRDLLAQVLSERMDAGRMTMETAQDIALKMLRENAVRVFQLEKKLGRTF